MTGQALLDSENVFYGLNARQRPAGEALSIQAVLFGVADERTPRSDLRVLGDVFDMILAWFTEASGTPIGTVDSYGKPGDKAVKAFLQALAAGEDSFARAWSVKEDGPVVSDALELALYRRGDATILHHAVGSERHAAENALVDEFRRRLAGDGARHPFLIGGADHDALHPADHAQAQDAALRLWFVLPVNSRVWRNAHRLGRYRHLDADHFVSIGEIIASSRGDRSRPRIVRARQRRHIESARAAGSNDAGRAGGQVSREVEDKLAALIGIHEAGLDGVPWGDARATDAVGDPWLVAAASRRLVVVAGADEWGRMQATGIAGGRAAHLVRQCGIVDLMLEYPGAGAAPLHAYLSRLGDRLPYHPALSALAEVMAQSATRPEYGRVAD